MKAISFESTGWNLPSMQRTRTSTTGKPASGPWRPSLEHALLDRRDQVARDRAADDLVHELEPGPAGQRLDRQVADAEHALAAGLLLELALHVLGASA